MQRQATPWKGQLDKLAYTLGQLRDPGSLDHYLVHY